MAGNFYTVGYQVKPFLCCQSNTQFKIQLKETYHANFQDNNFSFDFH